MTHSLVVATSNRGKLDELRALLEGLPIALYSVEEAMKHPPSIVEDGKTFADNACKKAKAVAAATMTLTLADDSGLEVDALDGAPGVLSARFAHARATDAENNAALMDALDTIDDPLEKNVHADAFKGTYRARFRCVLALVDPYVDGGEPRVVEGSCEGAITRTPRGSGGFGYDPLFLVAGTDKTMAELSEQEKNSVSHRAHAVRALRPVLEEIIASRERVIERIARG
jgi:XTP/dITP diphosphohydrolase